jgi:sulfur-carrier protein
MTIHVKYFASLRDHLGRAEDRLDVATDSLTVAGVWAALWPAQALPANTLTAVNLEYAELTQRVSDGDEVAFFPPVTGG